MKKAVYLLLFFINILPLYGEKVIVFEKPQANARSLIADKKFFKETGYKPRMLIEEHPLVFIHNMTEVKTASGLTGFLRDDLAVGADGKSIERRRETPYAKMFAGILAAIFLAFISFRAWKYGLKEWHLIMFPVLVRIILLSITLYRWDCVYTIASDEPGYFETISDMIKGNWSGPWRFTVGTGFFYLPFILLFNAKTFYDIVPYFNIFSAYVIAPAILVTGYLILRKLNVSGKKSCAAMLIWAIVPFVAFHLEDWDIWKFQHIFLFPKLFADFHRLVFYGFCINSGFNAMSDTPGLLTVMCCFLMALSIPPRCRYVWCFGMLYGFACLIRINYILLAPALFWICFCKFKDSGKLLTAAAIGVGGFLAIFAIQLICNAIQFGNPLTFGYILHYTENALPDRPVSGFTWHTFSRLTFTRYLLQSNLPVLTLGGAALWVTNDRFTKRVLTLMGIPTLLFFCGYSHTFCDARRFIFPTFAAFLMAIPAAHNVWNGISRLRMWMILILLTAMVMVTTPVNAYWKNLPLQIGDGFFLKFMAVAVPLALTGMAVDLLRKKHRDSAIFILLSMLFYYAPSEVLGAGLLLLLLWEIGIDRISAGLIEKVRSRSLKQ